MHTRLISAVMTGIVGLSATVLKASPGSSEPRPQVAYSVLAGSKPEYFEDPGRYLGHDLSALVPVGGAQLLLQTGFATVFEPRGRTSEFSDSAIGVRSPNILSSSLVNLRLQAVGGLPTSPLSQKNGLQGSFGSGVSLSVLFASMLSAKTSLNVKKYFYQYTLDSQGLANKNLDVSVSETLVLALGDMVSLSGGLSQVRRFYYQDSPKDLYESNAGVELAFNETLSIFAQIITSESLMQGRHENNVKLYERGITQAEVGLTLNLVPTPGGRLEKEQR